jgi:hypothetical protein
MVRTVRQARRFAVLFLLSVPWSYAAPIHVLSVDLPTLIDSVADQRDRFAVEVPHQFSTATDGVSGKPWDRRGHGITACRCRRRCPYPFMRRAQCCPAARLLQSQGHKPRCSIGLEMSRAVSCGAVRSSETSSRFP